MGFTSEVTARLRLDNSEFTRGLTKSVADVGKAGEDMNRKLHRAFGAGDAFKGILQGLGIASVEKVVDGIARMWSGVTKEAEENFRELGELSDKNTEAAIANMRKVIAEENLYQLLLKDRSRALANPTEGFKPREAGWLEGTLRTLANNRYVSHIFGPAADSLTNGRLAENEAGKAKAAEEAKARAIEADNKIKEIDAKREEGRQRDIEERAKKEKEYDDVVRENERKGLTREQEIAALKAEQRDLSEQALADSANGVEYLTKIERLEGRIKDLKKSQREEIERTQKALKDKTTDAAESWMDLQRAQSDRTAFTLEEVASGKGGITGTQRAKAREIQRLEAQAKRQRAQGFDTADASQSKADALRKDMDILKYNEREPMKDAVDRLNKLLDEVQQMRTTLNNITGPTVVP